MQQSNSSILLSGPEHFGVKKADAFIATGNANPSKLTRPKSVYKLLLLLLTGWLLVGINNHQAFAQPEIIAICSQELNFGDFYPGASGGTVKVNYNGIRSKTGDVVLLGGTVSPARIALTLKPNKTVYVGYPTGVFLSGPGGSLQLDFAPGDLSATQFISDSKNTDFTLYIGGTLTVKNIQTNPAGNYAGQFYVIFSYNFQ